MNYKVIHAAKRMLVAFAAVLLLGAVVQAEAASDSYPDKPIKLDVMYSPGGATDFQARVVTMLASKYLGEPVVIVNKPGAGGMSGWNEFVTSAKADGYELAAYNAPSFIAQSIHFKDRTKYNIRNMIPIANWGADPAVLIVPKDSPFDSVKDLVSYAKDHPGKITVSGAGLYTQHQIAALQLQKDAGIELSYIPAKGGVPALQMVMSGTVKAGFNNLSDAYRNRARLKILGIADLERNEEFLPDVPTFQELGYKGVDNTSINYRGIMAPEGTPPEIVEKLRKQFLAMFNDDKVKGKMKDGGSPMKIMDYKEVQAMWEHDEKMLKPLLKNL